MQKLERHMYKNLENWPWTRKNAFKIAFYFIRKWQQSSKRPREEVGNFH